MFRKDVGLEFNCIWCVRLHIDDKISVRLLNGLKVCFFQVFDAGLVRQDANLLNISRGFEKYYYLLVWRNVPHALPLLEQV